MSGGDLWNQLAAAVAKGNFFAVDARTWAKVCALGMNEAVAYLVQARGTGRDNCTTSWSVESIERYTGISRHRAAAAVKKLVAERLSRLLRGGTKPKYELTPYAAPQIARSPLSAPEQCAVNLIVAGKQLTTQSERQAAYRAVSKGWMLRENGQFSIRPDPKPDADLIWLPNELVTGVVGKIPPLELVRQTQDSMTLRLFIDLYHDHYLREEGGISRQIVWREFDRFEVGNQAQFTVWGFRASGDWVRWGNGITEPHRREKLTKEEEAAGKNPAIDFFRRTSELSGLGLIEWMPHLVESAKESGEIIHPLGLGPSGSIEDRLGRAACEAAKALLTEGQRGWAVENGIQMLVPVLRHIANVQLVGIARLRYRPHTSMTAAWWAELNANAETHLTRYAEIAARPTSQVAA